MNLKVNPIACTGHGVCAELLPELIAADEWGYHAAFRGSELIRAATRLAYWPCGRRPGHR
jgi:ferredoxin